MDFQAIDNQINDILNGTRDFPKFNQSEHAGICSAGSLLIGALIVCNNTRESLASSCNADGSKATPTNWQIDEEQERQLQKWAEYKNVWIPNAEQILVANYGQMIAQGAEAKVFYKTGDTHVVKLRTSIYAILERELLKQSHYTTICSPRQLCV